MAEEILIKRKVTLVNGAGHQQGVTRTYAIGFNSEAYIVGSRRGGEVGVIERGDENVMQDVHDKLALSRKSVEEFLEVAKLESIHIGDVFKIPAWTQDQVNDWMGGDFTLDDMNTYEVTDVQLEYRGAIL